MEVVEGTAQVESVDGFVAELDEISNTHGSTVQAFDARYVVDRAHVERAVGLAWRERERGNEIVRDPGVEILLYAAGRRQIQDALEMGVSEGECPVVIVAVGGDERGTVEDLRNLVELAETLGEYDPDRVRSFFGVDETELEATAGTLADIVRERVAMLVVER